MTKIVFVGGGSVGHIAPSVAVWRDLEKDKNMQATFVCANRHDDIAFLEAEHIPFNVIGTPKLHPLKLPQLVSSIIKATAILRREQPDLIFSKGGYVSVPICIAALLKRIPIVLHESDVKSGRANTIISLWAKAICKGFPTAESKKIVYTGNPVRPEMTHGSKESGYALTGFNGDRPVLIVTGGSQGSEALNNAISLQSDALLSTYDIIHITGKNKHGLTKEKIHYWQKEFVTTELADLYAISDVALARSGAGSIAELAANSIPAALCPLKNVPHAHQEKNAVAAQNNGGFILIQQEHLAFELKSTLQKLTNHESRTQSQKMHKPHSANAIANVIRNILASTA